MKPCKTCRWDGGELSELQRAQLKKKVKRDKMLVGDGVFQRICRVEPVCICVDGNGCGQHSSKTDGTMVQIGPCETCGRDCWWVGRERGAPCWDGWIPKSPPTYSPDPKADPSQTVVDAVPGSPLPDPPPPCSSGAD